MHARSRNGTGCCDARKSGFACVLRGVLVSSVNEWPKKTAARQDFIAKVLSVPGRSVSRNVSRQTLNRFVLLKVQEIKNAIKLLKKYYFIVHGINTRIWTLPVNATLS